MPIPPRAIPSTRRPGHNVPHKPKSTLSPTIANTLDWRAEVAFLDSYASGRKARSVPSPGVLIMDAASRARALDVEKAQAKDVEVKGGREVGLEELIHDGKNKREKRATTAATLGFDFVHTPSVLILPDETASTSTSSRPKLHPSSPLAQTPQTPSLLATSSAQDIPKSRAREISTDSSHINDDDSDLDEWEHIHILDGDADEEEEREEMMVGELEMDEDELAGLSLVDRKEAVGMRRVEGLSYAAVLGPR